MPTSTAPDFDLIHDLAMRADLEPETLTTDDWDAIYRIRYSHGSPGRIYYLCLHNCVAAHRCRLHGEMEAARKLSDNAETYYRALPADWRW